MEITLLPVFIANFLFLIDLLGVIYKKEPFTSALSTAQHNLHIFSGIKFQSWTFDCFSEALNKSNQKHLFHFVLLQFFFSFYAIYSIQIEPSSNLWEMPSAVIITSLIAVTLLLYIASYFQNHAYTWFYPKDRTTLPIARAFIGRGSFLAFVTFVVMWKGEKLDAIFENLIDLIGPNGLNFSFDFIFVLLPLIFSLCILSIYVYNETRQPKHYWEQEALIKDDNEAIKLAIIDARDQGCPLALICVNPNNLNQTQIKSTLLEILQECKKENKYLIHRVIEPKGTRDCWCILAYHSGAKDACVIAEKLLQHTVNNAHHIAAVGIAIHQIHCATAQDLITIGVQNLSNASMRESKIAISQRCR